MRVPSSPVTKASSVVSLAMGLRLSSDPMPLQTPHHRHAHGAHDHEHDHPMLGSRYAGAVADARQQEQRRLVGTLGVAIAGMLIEAVGGWLTNSLALLSDAGHMLADVGAIALSL